MEEGGGEDDEEEANCEDLSVVWRLVEVWEKEKENERRKGGERSGAYKGQSDDSLEARCHPVGLSRALAGALITLEPEACARQERV